MRPFLLVSCFAFSLCVANAQTEPSRYGFRVVNVYPHDMSSFTQGLLFHEGFLYEGTGKRGVSKLSKVSLEDAREIMSKPLDAATSVRVSNCWRENLPAHLAIAHGFCLR